jgi:uncharacterized membrane protein
MRKIEKSETIISYFLRAGVLLAGTLILVGWLSQLRWQGNTFFTFEIYDQISLFEILRLHLYREHWRPLISYAGLAILILLPLIRVFLTAILFLINKEFKLGFISVMVFLSLSLSILLGIKI